MLLLLIIIIACVYVCMRIILLLSAIGFPVKISFIVVILIIGCNSNRLLRNRGRQFLLHLCQDSLAKVSHHFNGQCRYLH